MAVEASPAVECNVAECNVSVVAGIASPATVRILESGTRLATLAIRAPAGEQATSVPVAWWEPPVWVETLADGDRVVAVGRFRRRFFRSGGGVASRVELEVERLARARRGREVEAALRWVDDMLAVLR